MITTIQIHQSTKNELEKFKEQSTDTYEEIIKTLMKEIEKSKRNSKELMIEGCKEMAEDSKKITKEWENADDLNWE